MAKATNLSTEPEDRDFVISRIFDAPRDLVWKAWTEPERLAQWWGPKGCNIRVKKLDVRPGGMFHYAMSYKPGHDMWGRFVYHEIAAPERLVYVSSFSDPAGAITRAPFPQLGPTFPLEVLNASPSRTTAARRRLTLRGRPLQATAEEQQDIHRHVRLDAAGLHRHLRSARRVPGDSIRHGRSMMRRPSCSKSLYRARAARGRRSAFFSILAAMKPDTFRVARSTTIKARAREDLPAHRRPASVQHVEPLREERPRHQGPLQRAGERQGCRLRLGKQEGRHRQHGDHRDGAAVEGRHAARLRQTFRGPQPRRVHAHAQGRCDRGHLGHERPGAVHGEDHARSRQHGPHGWRPTSRRASPISRRSAKNKRRNSGVDLCRAIRFSPPRPQTPCSARSRSCGFSMPRASSCGRRGPIAEHLADGGARGLHEPGLRMGGRARRQDSHSYARTRRHRVSDDGNIHRGRSARAPRFPGRRGGPRRQALLKSLHDRHLRGQGFQDQAHRACQGHRPRANRRPDARRHGAGLEPEPRQARKPLAG